MAHMIFELDRGHTSFETWHKCPQYITVDRPVTEAEAYADLDYTIQKMPLYRTGCRETDKTHMRQVIGANALVRTDHDVDVFPSVGDEFTIYQNRTMLDRLYAQLIKPNESEISVESVGTLQNGRVAFINLLLGDFQLPGDASKTVNRLGVFNSHGGRRILTALHDVRVQCLNTLKRAELTGRELGTLFEIRHTTNVADRVSDAVLALNKLRICAQEANAQMQQLSQASLTDQELDLYLQALIPDIPRPNGRTSAEPAKHRMGMRHWLRSDNGMTRDLQATWYGALQAATWHAGQARNRKVFDAGDHFWSGLYGNDNVFKQQALTLALKGAGVAS